MLEAKEKQVLKPYQHYIKYNNRCKKEVHWSITGACNYRCKRCFMSAQQVWIIMHRI